MAAKNHYFDWQIFFYFLIEDSFGKKYDKERDRFHCGR